MMSIFSHIVEDTIEVFMVRDSFDWCLSNLADVLKRLENCNLVLNFEKICNFMVKKVIVYVHCISEKGIEINRSKSEL